MVGFSLLVEPDQGDDDDTATNNVRLKCINGQTISGVSRTKWGSWTEWKKCPSGEAVVGLKAQIEKDQGDPGDDTALNGVAMYCATYKGTLWLQFTFPKYNHLQISPGLSAGKRLGKKFRRAASPKIFCNIISICMKIFSDVWISAISSCFRDHFRQILFRPDFILGFKGEEFNHNENKPAQLK